MAAERTVVHAYGGNRVSRALVEFLRAEASGGLLMLGTTVLALVVANSGLSAAYETFLHAYAALSVGDWTLRLSLHHWINDGLMAVFFFLVGLEIKREILFGELASFRRAALPVVAALGGAVVPALIYVAFNHGGAYARGWGIPMATDIAFAVTLLVLLGSRAPLWLKSFVTALAIADDIMAVLVIALFYSSSLDMTALSYAGVVVGMLFVANRFGVQRPAVYVALTMVLWYFVLQSGIHATIAGVLAAAFVPGSLRTGSAGDDGARAPDAPQEPHDEMRPREAWELVDEREAELGTIALRAVRGSAPLYRLEHAIHPWSAFVVLPVFAFANAGVAIPFEALGELFQSRLALGIIVGLFVGKQLGITAFAWLAVRLGLGRLPQGATWRQVHAGAALAGIGFTMSIFIGSLAFADPENLEIAKLAIIVGSLASAVVGVLALCLAPTGSEASDD